jgi:hypothetical protein
VGAAVLSTKKITAFSAKMRRQGIACEKLLDGGH